MALMDWMDAECYAVHLYNIEECYSEIASNLVEYA